MSSFGQLVQIDTSSGAWLQGYRRIYLVLIMDDFSRTVLAVRFFDSDSIYNLDDVFCLKQERKVAKDNSFSLDGVTYTIPREHNMVAFKVKLHSHPGKKIRV
jgi:hypothetical protein